MYSIHGSKPNMGCEFDVQKKILIKLKYQFLFACPNSHMKQDWKHPNFLHLLHGPPLLLKLYVVELLFHQFLDLVLLPHLGIFLCWGNFLILSHEDIGCGLTSLCFFACLHGAIISLNKRTRRWPMLEQKNINKIVFK